MSIAWGGSTSSPSSPQPNAYANSQAPITHNQSLNTASVPPPNVPNYDPSKGGKTVVNTAALDTFSSNLSQLITAAQKAHDQLKTMKPVAPGAFDKAWAIQDDITGDASAPSATASTAMQPGFVKALADLADGFTDLQTATKKMSQTYTTADELNGMKVSDLQKDLDTASGDFGGLVGGSGTSS